MGSENLSDSSSFAKDEVPAEEQSDAKTWKDGARVKAAVIKRIAVDMLRSYRTSAVKTLENATGRPLTAESKRRARLTVAHSPTFDYRITRTVSVKEAVRSMVTEIESFVDAGRVEDTVEESVFEITEPETVTEVHAEAVQLISAPKEVPMLAEAKPLAEDMADELVQECSSQFVQDGVASSMDMNDIGTENSPLDVVIRTQAVSVSTSSMAIEGSSMNPFPFGTLDDEDGVDFEELYEDKVAEYIVYELMPELVPEAFEDDADAPEYVISEIAGPIEAETKIEIPEEAVDDGVDYEELYEDITAFVIMSDVMPVLVPQVFSPDYEKYGEMHLITEIDLPVVEETIIDVPQRPVEEKTEDVVEEVVDDFDYGEFYEDFVAYEIVDEIMPRIVPEVFDPNYGKSVPDYVISEIAEPVQGETVIEVPEKFVPEYVISEIAEPMEDLTTIEVPEAPADTVTEDILPETVSTVTTFRFAFATTASPGRTGFSFIFGKPLKKEEESADYDDVPAKNMEHNEGTVFASPATGGTYQ